MKSKWSVNIKVYYDNSCFEKAIDHFDYAPFLVTIITEPIPTIEEIKKSYDDDINADMHPFSYLLAPHIIAEKWEESLAIGTDYIKGETHFHLPDNMIVKKTLEMLIDIESEHRLKRYSTTCKNWTELRARLISLLQQLERT